MKIEFINNNFKTNTPAYSRMMGFYNYFLKKEKNTINKKYLFITMPPFGNLKYFINPKNKIILDIRDGWSIAQESGYGGMVRAKPMKAKLTRIIERFMIRRAYITITCTNGLQRYLEKISDKKVLLIPNGVLDNDLELIDELKSKQQNKNNSNLLLFCCAGQFSEYGVEKAKQVCKVILNRYHNKKIKIQLIGSDYKKNKWVIDYFEKISSGRGSIEILPRMDKEDLYITMLNADYGLTIIRNPSYEFGTKVYDYIALGLPIINYFNSPNNFTNYFEACLDVSFNDNKIKPEIRRELLIEKELNNYFEISQK